ncbi:MAG: metalloregulator ArsR/SmtB family transcription factor [Deltaproteobacteria bacterium]|nr:metalloregulator ArsR/SmtB family transcription factor [Deltaproteobacteria bacterium]
MKAYADIFKALGDETRLSMIALLLSQGEMCVCDLMGVLAISQSKASRHLRYLLHAGLVTDRREGVWVYYRLQESRKTEASRVTTAIGNLITSRLSDDLKMRMHTWTANKQNNDNCCTDNSTTC